MNEPNAMHIYCDALLETVVGHHKLWLKWQRRSAMQEIQL